MTEFTNLRPPEQELLRFPAARRFCRVSRAFGGPCFKFAFLVLFGERSSSERSCLWHREQDAGVYGELTGRLPERAVLTSLVAFLKSTWLCDPGL